MRLPYSPLLLRRSLTSSLHPPPPPPPPPSSSATLSADDLAEITTLIPRLCDAGNHLHAVRLIDTALLLSPPLSALPLPSLTARLAALPDLTSTMALLTALRHNPRRPDPLPFCSLLISSYFSNRRLKEAAKVFSWLCRPDSPCRPDAVVYEITIKGFCWHGRALEAVRVVREMVRDGVLPRKEMREAVWGSLTTEARVDEARELDEALERWAEEGEGEGIRMAAEVLDRLIKEWEE